MRNALLFRSPFNVWDSFVDEEFSRTDSHVEENKDHYFIQMDVPGVAKEDIKISLEGRHLLIEAERKRGRETKIRKVFSLPDDVNFDKIEAQHKDGVLELAIPKAEKYKPKTIAISDGKESFWSRLTKNSETTELEHKE